MFFIVATALVLNCVVSAVLLLHFYRQTSSDKRSFLHYAMGYYACLIAVYVAYMMRFTVSVALSVAFTNFFSVLANCALLFAIQKQLEKHPHPWRSLWSLYPFFAAAIALLLYRYYPDKYLLRSLGLYIHNAILYLAVLYTLSGYFHRRPSPNSNVLSVAVLCLILLSFVMPLVFVTTSQVLTLHISLASIQLVVAQISLAIILILLFDGGNSAAHNPHRK